MAKKSKPSRRPLQALVAFAIPWILLFIAFGIMERNEGKSVSEIEWAKELGKSTKKVFIDFAEGWSESDSTKTK